MERLSPTQRGEGQGSDDEPGGDPVCWLSMICPECGRVPERPGDVCERCGAPRP
ncbi:MAG: hypothetical protein M3P93_10685 [Actinomycetota bacterium]|nr:hypothetical protein [Actinomycetota bacterium]